jgi:hypothetical protein
VTQSPAGTAGKIAGRVIDKSSGDPLPDANVVIAGTSTGAAADAEGYYFILNVPPGVYSVKAGMIGYGTVLQSEVRVQIDLTTTVDFTGEFALSPEAVQFAEVAVVADRPVVQPDISANVANIKAEETENLPVASATEIVELQAGVEPGLVIRGGGLDQLGFLVDGVAMLDARNNDAFTSVSFTANRRLQCRVRQPALRADQHRHQRRASRPMAVRHVHALQAAPVDEFRHSCQRPQRLLDAPVPGS